MKKYFIFWVLLGFLSVAALGADSSGTSTQKVKKSELDLHISHYIWFSGPSLGNFSGYQSDGESPVGFYNSMKFKTKISKNWSAYLNPRFNYQPVFGQDLSLLNPRIGVVDGKIYHAGNYNLAIGFGLELPVASGADEKYARVRAYQDQSYSLGKWTFDLYTLFAYELYRHGKVDDYSANLSFEMVPTIAYEVTPNITASAYLDASYGHSVLWRMKPLFYFNDISLTAEVDFQVTKRVMLAPYVAFPLTKDIQLDTVTVGFAANLIYL